MTFTEAALEVLRSIGEPLHYKRITELAIERNLLSHVGKTPEVTMSSRLATMVKKDRGSAPIIKVKPGVFAIRADAKLDPADVAAEAAEEEAAAVETVEGEAVEGAEKVAKVALPGSDVFPAEEDDDDPILAGLDDDESDSSDERRGRRRRRRRRSKGGEGSDNGTSSDEGVQEAGPSGNSGRRRDRDSGRDRMRDGNRDRDHDRDRDRDRGRSRPELSAEYKEDLSREPGDGDLLGKGLADAAYAVLSRADKGATSFARVADLLVARGRLSGQGSALAPTLAAALRADVASCERAGSRSRFLLRRGHVYLTDWLLPTDLVRAEESAVRNADRQRSEARRAALVRINDLPVAGFAELLATWLNAEGVNALRAVRRPGSGTAEFHFAGTRRRGPEEERLAIVVLRGGRDIDRESIIGVRGSLHHYGNATSAWIVSTGRISSGAREELAAATPAPVALFDGQELTCAMERQGIGLRARNVVISEVDFDLFEALGGDLQLPAAREIREPREGAREGREGREEGGRRRRRGRDRDRRGGASREESAASTDNTEPSALEDGADDGKLTAESSDADEIETRKRDRAGAVATDDAGEDEDPKEEDADLEVAAATDDDSDDDDSNDDDSNDDDSDDDDSDDDDSDDDDSDDDDSDDDDSDDDDSDDDDSDDDDSDDDDSDDDDSDDDDSDDDDSDDDDSDDDKR